MTQWPGTRRGLRERLNTVRKGLTLLWQQDYDRLAERIRRAVTPMEREYRKRYRMTLRDWLLYHQHRILFDQCRWMGLPALKNPLDDWIYQEILFEVRPDVVVEIGSAAGGGTLYLAHLLELIGHGIVVSVGMDRSKFAAEHDRIVTVTGRSDDRGVVSEVTRLCDGKRVVVIHDADHTREQVAVDLGLYGPLVSPGGYLIVEDGIIDLFRPNDGIGGWKPGPLPAIEQFLRENSDFRADARRERYLLTANPKGYLRRAP